MLAETIHLLYPFVHLVAMLVSLIAYVAFIYGYFFGKWPERKLIFWGIFAIWGFLN